ncbi:hypothetical protein LguiB_025022 [Lonicera macranthoides]
MATFFNTGRRSIKKAHLKLLTFHLIPNISSSSSSESLFSSLCKSQSQTPPPLPKKVPFTVTAHGRAWQDLYHWMSKTDDPDFINYLHHENSYADAFMADTHNLRRTLYDEMTSRMPCQISTPPERWGPWLYYQYIPEGKEYPVLCRKLATERKGWVKTIVNYVRGGFGAEEILLDWNEIAEKYGYVHVGTCRVSPDHHFLAYTLDITGGEQFMLQIKDLRSGCVLPKRVDGVVSLVYVIDVTNPYDGLRRFHKRVRDVQCFLEHHHGFFYILTNAALGEDKKFSSKNYYLARCQVADVQSDNWQNIIVPSEDVCLQDMDIFNEHMVLFLSKKGSPVICSIKLPIDLSCKKDMEIDNLDPWYFPLPSNSCTIIPGLNHDFMNSVYRVMPDVIVDYDMSENAFSIVHQEEVLLTSAGSCSLIDGRENNVLVNAPSYKDKDVQNGEVEELVNFSNAYTCERKEVISHDGLGIPLTILYSQKSYQKGQSPGLLQGYGAYGEVLDKSWCADRMGLLDRGWVIAFADVRGGGGVDPSWHKTGSGLHKLNSIKDFVSCGEYLINEGYVHKYRLGALGHSAGGLLVGAAINMYPELFRAAILKVPFLDICNTLLDPSLPLTVLDYEEFGNPQIKSQFQSILSYSPYDNIPQGVCCPAMLVTSSFHDSRVGVWEAAKWVAKVRDSTCSSCSSSVILKTNMRGGHFGEGGRFSQCEETAFEYAFLMKCPVRFLSFILASFKSHPTIDPSLESNTQESIDLDDSGPSSLDEFEEEEEEGGGGEFSGFMEYRMYRVIVEHNPFEEILSFWRRKERGEI